MSFLAYLSHHVYYILYIVSCFYRMYIVSYFFMYLSCFLANATHRIAYSTVIQYSTVQYSTVQYSTVHTDHDPAKKVGFPSLQYLLFG